MGPSEKTFQQVKSILGKLDRSIDQLREKRTTPPPPMHPSAEATRKLATNGDAAGTQPTARAASQYGRATPIQPQR
ncbi:MAG: hypothetical protein KF864_09255 [Phycisphaeraceae bacterium]|nr:hypothetical protein [Phycisphaeraceae bacterium]